MPPFSEYAVNGMERLDHAKQNIYVWLPIARHTRVAELIGQEEFDHSGETALVTWSEFWAGGGSRSPLISLRSA